LIVAIDYADLYMHKAVFRKETPAGGPVGSLARLSKNLDPAYLLECARKKIFLSFSKSIASSLSRKLSSEQIVAKPIINPLKINCFNISVQNEKINWKSSSKNNKLSLHSFNFLFSEQNNSLQSGQSQNLNLNQDSNNKLLDKLIQDWISQVPAGDKFAWQAQPTSQRITNWISYLSLKTVSEGSELNKAEFDKSVLVSLKTQLSFLKLQLEKGLADKEDLKLSEALIVAGVFFSDKDTVSLGLELLSQELSRIILSDGGHYLRSPDLLCLALEILISCAIALKAGHLEIPADLHLYIEKISLFLNAVLESDRLPALNYCTPSIAPKVLLGFIQEHNFLPADTATNLTTENPLSYFKESGLLLSRTANLAFSMITAQPSVHADSLAILASINSQQILTDSGSDTSLEDYFSSARAHNLLCLKNGKDEIVGVPQDVKCDLDARIVSAYWTHDSSVVVKRSVQLVPGGLVWIDSLENAQDLSFESNLHFAKGLSVQEDARVGVFRVFKILKEGLQLATLITESSCLGHLTKSPFCDGRGVVVERPCFREEGKAKSLNRKFALIEGALIEGNISWDLAWIFERLNESN
jgi:hypothetical protein